jgi:hypothetical protein
MAASDTKAVAPSSSSSSSATHRYQLRQRRSNAATRELASLQTSATTAESNNSDDSHDNGGRESPLPPLQKPKSPGNGVGLSPRLGEAFSSDNMFRAARGSDMENLLLFREQPRQIAVLGLVVAAVSYFSFTHDSQVRHICVE